MYNVMITGAGSVLGQSIYKALSQSMLSKKMSVYFLNSLENSAGFAFGELPFSNFYKQINKRCPPASSDDYLNFIDNFISENKIDIIYPGTQHEILKLSKYRKKKNNIACPTEEAVEATLNKYVTSKILEASRVPCAHTVEAENNLINELPKIFPVVIKPNKSSASRNVHICNSLEEVYVVLELFKYKNISSAVCQEYLRGSEYTCGVYLDKFSRLESQIIFNRELAGDGSSLWGRSVQNKDISNYLSSVMSTFVEAGVFDFGHINVQLRLTDSGPKLFEINGRLSSTEVAKAAFGFNSVEAYFYNIVLGREYSKFNAAREGSFVRYYDEVYF